MKGNEFITKNNFSHLENVTGASDFLPDSILQLSENLLSLSLHPSGQFHGWKLVRDKKAFVAVAMHLHFFQNLTYTELDTPNTAPTMVLSQAFYFDT